MTTDWDMVKRTLEARGLWNADGIGRRARARLCKRCNQAVMVGLDGDLVARVATCSPVPLSRIGEALVLLAGRPTYSLRWIAGRYEIDWRDQWQIKGMPAGSQQFIDVLGAHECNYEYTQPMIANTNIAEPTSKGITGDTPPF